MKTNELTSKIIKAAIEVHQVLGPGLLESIYEECLCKELALQNIRFKNQVTIPVVYKGIAINYGYRIDMVVEDLIVVEIKAVETILPIHEAQLLTYLKLGGWKVGLLLNFNVRLLKQGIKRIVYGFEE